MSSIPHHEVEALLHVVAEEVVLPGFHALKDGDVAEKGPDDYVTAVDLAVERRLSDELVHLLPGSRCIGEEACHHDASLLASLGEGTVWLIDPIDGTRNLVAGDPDFVVMVALLQDGKPLASWMNAPAAGWRTACERGAGASIDGRAATVPVDAPAPGVIYSRFIPEELLPCLDRFRGAHPDYGSGSGSAGCDYHALVTGRLDFALFWRTLAWDHTAGALLLEEAGAAIARLDGDPYLPVEWERLGLLAARSERRWHALVPTFRECLEL